MEISHDREYLKHLFCCLWGLPPVLSAKGDLGDLLSRTEAVVNSATSKALLPEMGMNAATEVWLQVRASLPGAFIDREI